jgi:ribosomal protein L7Ae-like RNA K-turn-binding protein
LVVVGVELTRKAVGAGKVKLAVVAADVSEHSKDKIVPLLVARDVATIEIASARALGEAVGRATTAVVGVLDAKLARGVRAACEDIRR